MRRGRYLRTTRQKGDLSTEPPGRTPVRPVCQGHTFESCLENFSDRLVNRLNLVKSPPMNVVKFFRYSERGIRGINQVRVLLRVAV